jgi:2-keto-4-pentenoate hydratase
VSIEQGDRDQVQIKQVAAVADVKMQVKERLTTAGVVITSQQHGPHGIIIEHVGDLLQRGGNKDANVLFDDQVVNPSQLGSLGAILRVLDGSRCLTE